MLISYKWLKDFVEINEEPLVLADRLTMTGTPAEDVSLLGAEVENVVSGCIVKLEKHPDADRLQICQIDCGEYGVLQIVTGATNVFEGAKVPVAMHGANLPDGVKIKRGKLRGVASNGMLCSAKELAIDASLLSAAQKEGIFILPEDVKLGLDIREVMGLDDTVIDFELTPNRGDCMSHVGIAREVSAVLGGALTELKIDLQETQENAADVVTVRIDDAKCGRYIARVIKGVKIAASPLWLQNRLRAVGVRPVSNVVDVTNYVMFALGQPLHAFDLANISGNSIIVRSAAQGEEFTTLDAIKRTLTSDTLMIADGANAIAIAGVMGGLHSEVTAATEDVLLECALFDGVSVRKTAQALALRTEASSRYEKGIDANMMDNAVDMAAAMIAELSGGRVLKGRVDARAADPANVLIAFDSARINAFLGIDLAEDEMKKLLASVGISIEAGSAVIPTWRPDMSYMEDLAEEVARLYGYDNIEGTLPWGVITCAVQNEKLTVSDVIKDVMTAAGYYDTVTYSMIGASAFDRLKVAQGDKLRDCVAILNPLSEEYRCMRTTLLPSLLDCLKRNISRQTRDVRLFETARVFLADDSDDWTKRELDTAAAIVSLPSPGSFSSDGDMLFFELKGQLDALCQKLGIKGYSYRRMHAAMPYHPGRAMELVVGSEAVAFVAELHPDVLQSNDIEQRVAYCEISTSKLADYGRTAIRYKQLPKYPAVERDLAFVADDVVANETLQNIIVKHGGSLLERVELFDLYKGKQIESGKKSMAYSLLFRASDRTLVDADVDAVITDIKAALADDCGAALRQ